MHNANMKGSTKISSGEITPTVNSRMLLVLRRMWSTPELYTFDLWAPVMLQLLRSDHQHTFLEGRWLFLVL